MINRKTIGELGEIILRVIDSTEPLISALVSPRAKDLVDFMFGNQKIQAQKKFYYKKRLMDLVQKGYIEKNIKQKSGYNLTEKGKKALILFQKNKKVKKWDNLWRIVIFDVYENNRNRRDRLRNELKEFGFTQLQKSVWVYPYPCDDFITLLKTDLQFGKNVRYIVAKRIDDNGKLEKHFSLK